MAALIRPMFENIYPTFKVFFQSTPLSCHVFKVRYFSTSFRLFATQYYRVPDKYKKKKPDINIKAECEKTKEEAELDQLIKEKTFPLLYGHRVFVIQPYIKWGVKKKRNTTPELQLLEAVTLIKTLRQWKVVGHAIQSLQGIHINCVFGTGVLEQFRQRIVNDPKISAVFISLNTLTIRQQVLLEETFKVPVFDRFSIIMHIFKEHACTKEAKLQIELAQLPYLWTVLRGVGDGVHEKIGVSGNYLGGNGPKLLSDRKEVFKIREAKLKKEISELREQRELFRQRRKKHELPVVAVIGYTNAGKTSLIKALTGKESLEPQDYLFATLDVTSHLGVLPSGLKAYFVDTLGFINDIPTYLMESFISTFEDVAIADVVLNVRDISHPDTVAQNDNVLETLKNLNLGTGLGNVISVGNKVDLVEKTDLEKYRDKDLIFVSSVDTTGIDILRQAIEKKILQSPGLTKKTIKVRSGGPEYCWLQEHSTVVKETPDLKDTQFTLLETIISDISLAKFKHIFIENYNR